MLVSLENYAWRYCSATELVNMILAFVETRALSIFNNVHFLDMSESMVTMIMGRNLEVCLCNLEMENIFINLTGA